MNSLSHSSLLNLGGNTKTAAGQQAARAAAGPDLAASFSDLLRSNSTPAPASLKPPLPPAPAPAPTPAAAPKPAEAGNSAQPRSEAAAKPRPAGQERELQARQARARAEAGAHRSPADKTAKPADPAAGKTAAGEAASTAAGDAADAKTTKRKTADTEAGSASGQPAALATPLDNQTVDAASTPAGAPIINGEQLAAAGRSPATDSARTTPGSELDPGAAETAGGRIDPAASPAPKARPHAAAQDLGAATASSQAAEAAADLPVTRSPTELQAGTARSEAAPGAPAAAPAGGFEALLNAAGTPPLKHGAEPGTGATAPARLELAQPLYSQDFAPEMAARLSLLAADGVQQAELHLNPAEMGPVSVQILVDGQQAQISFHSDQAETRAVLEGSLPELAAALRENGLTLSGGGVFQQARDQGQAGSGQQADGGPGRRFAAGGGATEGEIAPQTAPARQPRSVGVLDMYA